MSPTRLADTFGEMRNLIETAPWKALSWSAACLAGALTFLKLIANEKHLQQMELEVFEKGEMKAFQERMAARVAADAKDGLLTVQAVPSKSFKS